jgi:Trk-type K+ transport system membrane component
VNSAANLNISSNVDSVLLHAMMVIGGGGSGGGGGLKIRKLIFVLSVSIANQYSQKVARSSRKEISRK